MAKRSRVNWLAVLLWGGYGVIFFLMFGFQRLPSGFPFGMSAVDEVVLAAYAVFVIGYVAVKAYRENH